MRIEDLRKWLDDEEAKWDEESTKYLGEYKDQEILLPYFSWDGKVNHFGGWSKDLNIFWDVTGLGIFMDVKEKND